MGKREWTRKCQECKTKIWQRPMDIEVWLNFNQEGAESDIFEFCSFKCLEVWAKNKQK